MTFSHTVQPALAMQASGRKLVEGIRALVVPLTIFATVRLCLMLIAYGATILFPRAANGEAQFAFGTFTDPWVRWDSYWYMVIAERGYSGDPASGEIAFFPLFPLLMRMVRPIAGSWGTAGVIVSNLFLALALCFLYRLVADRFNKSLAQRAVLLTSCFPYAFFFGAVYTEGLFLASAAAAFFFAEKRQWWLAAAASAMGSATRLVGAGLATSLLLTYLHQRDFNVRAVKPDILFLLLSPLGLAGFMVFQFIAYGDPLSMVAGSLSWGGQHNPLETDLALFDPRTFGPDNWNLVLALNMAIPLIALALVIPSAKVLGPGYAFFVLIGVLVPFSQHIESMGRYTSVLFPIFVTTAYHVRGRIAFKLLLCVSTLLLTFLTILFANGYLII